MSIGVGRLVKNSLDCTVVVYLRFFIVDIEDIDQTGILN